MSTQQLPNPLATDRDANPSVIWLHGVAAMGDEQWPTALTAFARFLELVESGADRQVAFQNLTVCHLALADYAQALAVLDQAEEEWGVASDRIHLRAIVYGCAGEVDAALATFDLLSRHDPDFVRRHKVKLSIQLLRRIARGKAVPGAFLFDYLTDQVRHNIELREFAIVEQKARRMIAAEPRRPEGHFVLGVALLELARYAEALAALRAADVRDPNHAQTLYNMGYTYEKMALPAEAIDCYERAIKRDPQHKAALHHLGRLYAQQEQRTKAISLWRRALQLQPDYYPAKHSLFEIGAGPEPIEPPLPPNYYERMRMTPLVKARMQQPQVFCNGELTLTLDPVVGFILEDTGNLRNGTIHAGGPFRVAKVTLAADLLDLMGMIKLLLTMINGANTRDIAILIYYANGDIFNYRASYQAGQLTFDSDGRFVVTELPRLFKLRMDSDLASHYGDPMQGVLIYLNQEQAPGVLVNTLGLGGG